MSFRENLKREIIKYYENDPRIKNKINLDSSAMDIYDTNLNDFKLEIYNYLNKDNEQKSSEELENIEELEEVEVVSADEEEQLDLSMLGDIEEKVLSILQSLNISLYNKDELKKTLIEDMLNFLLESGKNEESIGRLISGIPKIFSRIRLIEELKKMKDFETLKLLARCYPRDRTNKKDRFLSKNMSREDHIRVWYYVNSISWYIENHIEHEFQEFELKKRQMKKDLLTELINKILPEVQEHFADHGKKRLKKITKKQIINFLKFLLEELDNKYIKVDKKNKKLNNEDYLFLKSKVKRFITEKYRATFPEKDLKLK
jgi:hypothetical protein